jgi:hypothetical protein
MHVYRGPWPSEWLIVSLMDKASGGGMNQWVDAIVATAEFPVLEMLDGEDKPTLLEWRHRDDLGEYTKAHGLDDAHAYCGLAMLPGADRHVARIYILLARRATLAWKITLAFESACLPRMPERIVAANDHVRAGAVLGGLRLG